LPRTDPACGGRSVPVRISERTATRAVPTIIRKSEADGKRQADGRFSLESGFRQCEEYLDLKESVTKQAKGPVGYEMPKVSF